jgi:glycyl-tRNA synthetase beta chain
VKKLDLLLEIGSEEIPAGYIAAAVEALRGNVIAWLQASHLDFDSNAIETFATPRRLALRVRGVASEQAHREQTKLGPAVAAAFDADGNPTRAAAGFARGAGVDVTELVRVDSDRGERVAAVLSTGGASAKDLLLADGLLEEWTQLPFPKTMRWIPGDDYRYARPVRWVVLLLDDEIVEAKLRNLVAGRLSRGHRTLSPEPVEIASATDYETTLASHSVVVSPTERRSSIESAARAEAEKLGGVLHEDAGLLDEITFLTEHPQVLHGKFDVALVDELPSEVIITAMRSHQRYFSVEKPEGALLPAFLTFRDGDDAGLAQVALGNERVLRARLDDALFYWNEDCSLSSEDKIAALDRIVWLEGFGSMADKCRRVAKLAEFLRRHWKLETIVVDDLKRASHLCKSDLATEMIRDGKEFTKLQGIMGRYYALEAGESATVADAIAEHLYPKHASDRLPDGDLATLVALADRLDSIAGSLLAGFAPTGSADPYALRRQSLAVLRILLEHEWHLDLDAAVEEAFAAYDADRPENLRARAQAADLFGGRLESVLSELPAEIVRGILAVRTADPLAIVRAARSLAALAGSESFQSLLAGAKRCRNLLAKENRLSEEAAASDLRNATLRGRAEDRFERWVEHGRNNAQMGFSVDAFEDAAEGALYHAVKSAVPSLQTALAVDDAGSAYEVLAGLGPPIDAYFETVLVNAPQAELRANRLSFLEDIHYLFAFWADLSVIPTA